MTIAPDDRLDVAGLAWLVPTPALNWTPPLAKDLLNRKLWKFERHPWPAWFAQRGGPDGVRDFVAGCPVPPQLQPLFRAILEQPGMGRAYYAATVGMNTTTVSDQLTRIAVVLALHLNQWQVVVPSVSGLSEREMGGRR